MNRALLQRCRTRTLTQGPAFLSWLNMRLIVHCNARHCLILATGDCNGCGCADPTTRSYAHLEGRYAEADMFDHLRGCSQSLAAGEQCQDMEWNPSVRSDIAHQEHVIGQSSIIQPAMVCVCVWMSTRCSTGTSARQQSPHARAHANSALTKKQFVGG